MGCDLAHGSGPTVDRVALTLDTGFAALTLDTGFAALALPENDPPGTEADGTLAWQAPDGSTGLLLGTTENPRAELWR